ncbi:hypothetical protein EK904_010479 [Melospiza melodia maxima]|nr:hypothetical protein EK904_010479 [Melospiza melodia maxima]
MLQPCSWLWLFPECPHSSSFLQRSGVHQGHPSPEVSKSAGAQLKEALALLLGTNTFSKGFCAGQAPPSWLPASQPSASGAALVPIIPIVCLCPFHIFHGLNSVHNAAHRPGLCVTQYLLLANVRSASAFKTSDAINELSCIIPTFKQRRRIVLKTQSCVSVVCQLKGHLLISCVMWWTLETKYCTVYLPNQSPPLPGSAGCFWKHKGLLPRAGQPV